MEDTFVPEGLRERPYLFDGPFAGDGLIVVKPSLVGLNQG